MVACGIVKTLMVPPMLVLLERAAPDKRAGRPLRPFEVAYGKSFAWLATRAPRVVLAVAAVVALGGTFAATRHVARDPLDYDTRTLETSGAGGATPAVPAARSCSSSRSRAARTIFAAPSPSRASAGRRSSQTERSSKARAAR